MVKTHERNGFKRIRYTGAVGVRGVSGGAAVTDGAAIQADTRVSPSSNHAARLQAYPGCSSFC